MGNELSFASFIARVLATLNPSDAPVELSMADASFAVTEERAVSFWFAVSGALLLVSLSLVCLHRTRFGPSRFFVPLIFATLIMLGSLLKVTYETGLLYVFR